METRLGDIIDDFCVKCKRIMNHAVVSILDGAPAKVRCRTCYNDHDYRHEQAPPPKVDPRKAALFKEVLAKIPGSGDPAVEEPAAEEPVELLLEAEATAEPAQEVVKKPKAKVKAKSQK
jgi:hypothetical protein